ncbi:hypothetical protein [Psychrobacter sp. UBA3962]|uniref:hypothetical protein n=1 Tax=Psychrobacter sp. UBA3962 TaxID=1947352 RepID=UPI0025F49890|nr:hypothetical protein [Psychrobacter sp. UBA3962]
MQDNQETKVNTSQTKEIQTSHTKNIETVHVSITNAVNNVYAAQDLKLCIGLTNNNDEPVAAHKEVAVNIICTGTAANGDEYIGSRVVIIASGSSSTEYAPFLESYLKAEQIDQLSVALIDIKGNEFADLAIDASHNFIELAMIDYQQDGFSVAEITVDGVAGVVEFTVVLSGAPLTREASVDYFLGKVAVENIDCYRLDAGTLTFNPGIISHTVTQAFSDSDYEYCDSNFEVVLTNGVNAQIKECSGQACDRHNQNTQPDLALVSIVENTATSIEKYDLAYEGPFQIGGGSFAIELRDSKGALNIANTDVTVEVQYSGTMTDETDFVGKVSLIVPANSASFDFDIAALDKHIVETSEAVDIELSHAYGGGFKAVVIDQNKSAANMSIRDMG